MFDPRPNQGPRPTADRPVTSHRTAPTPTAGVAFGRTLIIAALVVLALAAQVIPQPAAADGTATPMDSSSIAAALTADRMDQSTAWLQTCSWEVLESYDDYVETYHLYRMPSSEQPGPWIALECETLPPHMDVGLPRPNSHFAGWAADGSPPDWLLELLSR